MNHNAASIDKTSRLSVNVLRTEQFAKHASKMLDIIDFIAERGGEPEKVSLCLYSPRLL